MAMTKSYSSYDKGVLLKNFCFAYALHEGSSNMLALDSVDLLLLIGGSGL